MTIIPRKMPLRNLISFARRHGISLRNTSHTQAANSQPASMAADVQAGRPASQQASISEPVHLHAIEIPLDNPDRPSTNLKRPLRGLLAKIKRLPGRVLHLYQVMRPPLTPDEEEELKIKQESGRRDKLAMREAMIYGIHTSRKLAQLGLRELELVGNGANTKHKMKLCKWDMVARDELFTMLVMRLNTDPRYLPAYVRVSELGRNPLFADELLPTLKHYVRWESNEAGVFLTIFRKGLDGLPDFVTAEELWKRIPDNTPLLTIPVGFGNNSKRTWIDLDDCPHLLVAGATKWGKSNFVNNIICFWLHRNVTPDDLQLVLFDLKRGLEFAFYEGLPHLLHDEVIPTGIVEEIGDVLPVMRRLQEIRDARMDIIKRAGYKNFNDYNRGQASRQKKLPAIVIVIDEWAKIRLSRGDTGARVNAGAVLRLAHEAVNKILEDPNIGAIELLEIVKWFGGEVMKIREARHFGLQAESMLAEFTNLARAAGMYVILATQNPTKEVLSGLIKVNFSSVVAMRLSVGGSLATLGTQSATGLEVKGRCILLDGGQEQKLQTPFVSDSLIRAEVYHAKTGKDLKSFQVDLEEILLYALQNMEGALDIAKLYEIFRVKRVRKDWIMRALRDSEGHEYNLMGTTYRVLPRGSHLPRSLERVDMGDTSPVK